MSKREILAGSTDQTIDVFIQDSSSTTGAGLTGLAFNSPGLTCYYRNGATGTPVQLVLVTQTVDGAHSDGGFVEIDATNMKGCCRLDLSDVMVATLGMLTIVLQGATNMAPCVLEIEIVSVDKFDSVRGGMTALPNAAADAAGGIVTGDGSVTFTAGVGNRPSVDVTALGGTVQSATDLKDFADAGYDPATNKVQGVVLVDTLTTYTGNTPQTGDSFARIGATGSGLTSLAQASAYTATRAGYLDNINGHTAQTGDNFARLGAPAGASVSADIATVDANVDTILTRITATLFNGITSLAEWLGLIAGKQAGNATALTEIKATGAGAGTYDPTTDSVEAIRDRGDAAWITATNFSTHTAADVRTEMDANSTQLAAIVADTNELQTDDVPGLIAALNDLSAAQINAEVVDVLRTDTNSELAQGIPPATPTFEEAVMFLYMALRNKLTVTATEKGIYNDAGTKVARKTLSDDGTVYTEAEAVSGA